MGRAYIGKGKIVVMTFGQRSVKNRWEVGGKGLYREGKVGEMPFGQRSV